MKREVSGTMTVRLVRPEALLERESRFSLDHVLLGGPAEHTGLAPSLREFGVLSPLLAFEDGTGGMHLINGFKRAMFARKEGIAALAVHVIREKTPVEAIMAVIFQDRFHRIAESVINKVQFIDFVRSSGASEDWILNALCIPLEMKPHGSFLKECERIGKLPHAVKGFCHDKKMSLKQVLNLTSYPVDLLGKVMEWRPLLQLSASVLDEVASSLRDVLVTKGIAVAEFTNLPVIRSIMESELSQRERTERLRSFLREEQYPVLSGVNARIDKTVRDMGLPDTVTVSWDRTLENKRVDLIISVKDQGEWKAILKTLDTDNIESSIRSILDEL